MPNKRGDGETNIQKYGYFNLKNDNYDFTRF